MKKLLSLLAFLLIVSPCFSQPVHTQSSIDKGKLICLPDSILRKVATDLVLFDQCKQQLTVLNLSMDYLNQIITFKDSVINEKEMQMYLKDGIISIHEYKFSNKESQYKQLDNKYSVLKRNDRLKMGIAGVLISILSYALITNH